MDKKYQIFVSSTYKDLIAERKVVFEKILKLKHIPAGMESFPAINMKQFEYIKKRIDDCDYYILIVAGMYGTLAEDGISYTEKEYDYAISQKIPVLIFIHTDYRKLSGDKIEDTDAKKEKLDAFIKKISQGDLVAFWDTADKLGSEVATSLPETIAEYNNAIGWVRANQTANTQTLIDHINLKNENEALKAKLSAYENTKIQIDNLADFDDVYKFATKVIIEPDEDNGYRGNIQPLSQMLTWRKIFILIATDLRSPEDKEAIQFILEKKLKIKENIHESNDLKIPNDVIDIIINQFEIYNLINFITHKNSYSLTKKGEQIMLQSLAVTKNQETFVVEL